MIKSIVTDLSKVILHSIDDTYTGSLNGLNDALLSEDKNYKFFDHFRLNTELLDFYILLSEKIPIYIFTSGAIQEHSAIRAYLEEVFDGVFSASKMGVHKSEAMAYFKLTSTLGVEPTEMIYIDDTEVNIGAASECGINAILHKDNTESFKLINSFLDV